MKVSDILAAKGGNKGDVIGIEPSASLAVAAKLLSRHRIGAVVIRGAGASLIQRASCASVAPRARASVQIALSPSESEAMPPHAAWKSPRSFCATCNFV